MSRMVVLTRPRIPSDERPDALIINREHQKKMKNLEKKERGAKALLLKVKIYSI